MKDGPGVPTRTVHTRGPARVSAGQSFSRLPAQPRLAGRCWDKSPHSGLTSRGLGAAQHPLVHSA